MKRVIGLFLALAILCSSSVTGLATNYNNEATNKEKSLKSEFEYVVEHNELVKKYLTDEEINYYRNIINIKEENPNLAEEEIVKLISPTITSKLMAASSSGESTGVWNLTDAEKLLIAKYPIQALKVNACKESADQWTDAWYPTWTDGDEGNAYRHAFWNAMMTEEIGVISAQQFATAHENHGLTDAEYKAIIINGFNGLQHREMDLYNNNIGRTKAYPHDGELDVHNKLTNLISTYQLRILVK